MLVYACKHFSLTNSVADAKKSLFALMWINPIEHIGTIGTFTYWSCYKNTRNEHGMINFLMINFLMTNFEVSNSISARCTKSSL